MAQLGFDVDFGKTLRDLARLAKPQRARVAALFLIILVVEASYVFDKYLLKLVIDNATAFESGALLREGFIAALLLVAGIFAAILLLRVILKFIHIHLINRVDAALIYALKRRVFDHLLGLSHRFHTTHKTGSMISKLSRGGRAVETLMDVIVFSFLPTLLLILLATATLLIVSVPAAIVVALVAAAFISYSVAIQAYQIRFNTVANDAEDLEKGNMSDFLANVEAVKYYGKERAVQERYGKLAARTRDSFLRMWDYYRFMDSGQAFILGAGAVLAILVGVRAILDGSATVGDLAFIYTIYLGVIGPLFGFMHGIRQFYRATVDFTSLMEYEKERNEVVDGKRRPRLSEGGVEFRDVTFGYGEEPIFRGLTLMIKPRERVALVGHSGSGKSSVVKLLYRLYDVQEGAILVDSVDIREYRKEAYRSQMSIVPQEPVLFDDTVYENVRFSRPSAKREEVLRAMRFAQLDRVVARLPEKEHTIVGERGVRLSGGEKQRVSIARALLADQPILVLDEATSALDSETEREIHQDLDRLMEGRTTIIIAHRLSTVMRADRIVVLEYGRIVQMGTHVELLDQPGPYQRLWRLQQDGYFDEDRNT